MNISNLGQGIARVSALGDSRVVKTLGSGYEGVVYLVADRNTTSRSVIKVFHTPRPRRKSVQGLQVYADCIPGTFPGLARIRLIEDGDYILGVAYEHRPLYPVHYRLLRAHEQLQQVLFATYCRMQAYLISTARLALIDAYANNFLLDRAGRFHWVDYGFAIQNVDDPHAQAQGLFGYGLATLLLSLYFVNIQPQVTPADGYSQDEPCRYCLDPRLDALAQEHHWLRAVLDEVCCPPAAAFLDPEFYRHLGADLPECVATPGALLLANQMLHASGPLWSRLKVAATSASAILPLRPLDRSR